jgi:CDP-glucose 4,6-dehydratase
MGTVNMLEALRATDSVKSAVMVTTDKVYRDQERDQPYHEGDVLGGYDPYSASKAASELIIDCYRNAFLRGQGVNVASARAGNVIGGGDWAQDRIIPDAIRHWKNHQILKIRYPHAIRPWQHVLEPLYGYIILAQALEANPNKAKSYNFGPNFREVSSVEKIIRLAKKGWGEGEFQATACKEALKETAILMLDVSMAERELGVAPVWNVDQAVDRTINWYKREAQGVKPFELCIADLNDFEAALRR